MLKFVEGKHYAVNPKGCWVWSLGTFSDGYGYVWVNGGNVGAHVLSHLLYRGPTKDLMVLHTCDTRRCVNPEHLYLGDHLDNMVDRRRRSGTSTLSDDQIRAMRAEYALGKISQRDLGKKYGMSQTATFAIVNRDTWSDVR